MLCGLHYDYVPLGLAAYALCGCVSETFNLPATQYTGQAMSFYSADLLKEKTGLHARLNDMVLPGRLVEKKDRAEESNAG